MPNKLTEPSSIGHVFSVYLNTDNKKRVIGIARWLEKVKKPHNPVDFFEFLLECAELYINGFISTKE